MEHRAKKSLGQNFLKNEGIIKKIRDAADPTGNDIILEIGPGKGALTKELLDFAGKVIAVEKDDALFTYLKEQFSNEIVLGKFDLINDDILKFDPEILRFYGNYKLVANIPYNITGAIIEKFLSVSFQPEMMVLMVQKEVAERIVAKDKKIGKNGKESILSIAIKVYGIPTYICTVKSGSFAPAPSIDSAVIKISNISRKNFINKHHEEVFFQIMKAGFAHKRKILSGNLKNILEPEFVDQIIKKISVIPSVRAEDLSINDWLNLSELVYNNQYGK